MIGRTYLYNGEQYTIGDIAPHGKDKYTIVTDKRALNVTEKQLKNEFLPVTVPKGSVNTALVKRMAEEFEPVTSIVATIQENINKLKMDPNFIPQAKAINEQVKSAIALAKVKIEVLKLAKGK